MNGNLYGSAGGASLNPRLFMVQALKKLLINNGNILKFYSSDFEQHDKEKMIRLRLANSVALIDAMKSSLNLEEPNEAVEEVVVWFDWIIKELDEIEDVIIGRKEQFEQDLEEKISNLNYIIRNILEGFEGLE